MNEHTATISVNVKDKSDISQYVYEVANFTPIASSDLDTLRYLSNSKSLFPFLFLLWKRYCATKLYTVPNALHTKFLLWKFFVKETIFSRSLSHYENCSVVFQKKKNYFLFCRYSAQTLASQSLLLMTIIYKEASSVTIVVNCEKMVVGSMILNEIKNRLLKV